MEHERQRLRWVDTAKGGAILLVVIGHAWRGLHDAGLMEMMPDRLFAAIDMRIYAFHMPLFFLLSGLFIATTMANLSIVDFVGSRLLRLVYPLVLWTYVFALIKYIAGDYANEPLGLDEVFASPIPGRWHFWFLWALFVLQIGLLILRPFLISKRWRSLAIWGVLVVSVLGQAAAPLPFEIHYWTSNALKFLPYLALGMVLADLDKAPQHFAERHGLLFLGTFVVVLAAVPSLAAHGVPYLLTALVLVLSSAGMAAWWADRDRSQSKTLAVLGRYSMIIFLSHTIFSAGAREALIAFDIQDLLVHMILATGVGLALPIALQHLVERR